ncbi:hypothetical protein C1H76_5516 [Elsinoe australis]|uniref:Uncharacterized protein n=1 Tax=Elsinoe australis TaxID=40998 RepID=A0A4U7B4E6_9PEZI|nr:hypothetical protein C1H76_5516 [Elsinoe australis]
MTVTTRSKRSQSPSSLNVQDTPHQEKRREMLHNGKSFEQLPREIRDQIYHESLVSSSCIDVKKLKAHQEYHDFEIQGYYNPDSGALARSLAGLNMSLLKTSRRIADEAAAVFYSKNKFAFHGHKDWSVVVDWLRSIGEKNRRHLTNIEIDVRQQNRVYQYSDGTREDYSGKRIHPRHPLLRSPKDDGTWPVGEVDDVDVDKEEIFSALTECSHGSKLNLHVRYVGGGLPGCFEDPEDENEANEDYYFSMDLPNLMEAWRANYSNPERRQVEVLWYFWGPIRDDDRTVLDIVGDQLRENGFEILGETRAEDVVESLVSPGNWFTQRTLKVNAKRRPLSGPIIHSEPNVYNTSRALADIREEKQFNIDHGFEALNEYL